MITGTDDGSSTDEWDPDDYSWADEDTVDYTDDSNDESGLTTSGSNDDDDDDDDEHIPHNTYSSQPDYSDDLSPTEIIYQTDQATGTDTDSEIDASDSDIVTAFQESSEGTGVTQDDIDSAFTAPESEPEPEVPQNQAEQARLEAEQAAQELRALVDRLTTEGESADVGGLSNTTKGVMAGGGLAVAYLAYSAGYLG